MKKSSNARRSLLAAVTELLESRQLLAAYALDPTFGDDGRVYDGNYFPDEIALQPGGKVAVLADDGLMGGVILQRYNPDGTRDTSFSAGIDGDDYEATDIEASGDKLFVGAAFHVVSSHMGEEWLAGAHIYRLNANGSIDTSWGTDGLATMPDTGGNDRGVVDMLVLPDGKLLALADTMVTDTGTGASWPHYSVARFNANGTVDTSFGGGDGVVHISSGGRGGSSVEMEIQPTTGEVVVLGSVLFNTGEGLQLARLNADGTIDTSYGGAFEPFSGHPGAKPTSLDFQSTGAAIITGAYNSDAGSNQSGFEPFGYLVRYDPQGDPDNSLKMEFDRVELEEVQVLPGNSMLIAGTVDGGTTPATRRAMLWSVGPDGQNNEMVRTGWNTSSRGIHLDIQNDGKVILAGYGMSTPYGAPNPLGLARFSPQSGAGAQTPFKGTPFTASQTVEFEDFDNGGPGVSFSDTSGGNAGSAYRSSTDVDIYGVSGASNAHVVGLTRPGEWMEYTFNVTQAGTYTITTRLASVTTGTYHYEVDGANVTGSRTIPNTGSYNTYTTVTSPQFNLSAGTHVIRVAIDSTNAVGTAANLDWFKLNLASSGTNRTPFKGVPFSANQIVEAEDFDNGGQRVGSFDVTEANEGGAYRSNTGTDIYTVSGASNGHVIGLTRPSEWMAYSFNVTEAGAYSFDTRYATPATLARYYYEVDGLPVTEFLNFSRTGAYETYATTRTPTFHLSAGPHTVRLFIDQTNAPGTAANIDWIRLNHHTTSGNQTPFTGTPFGVNTTIQAEDYDRGGQGVAYNDLDATNKGGKYRTSEGVDVEATGDTGGGFNVGYTAPGEWIEYTISIPTTGEYNIQTRLGAVQSGTMHYEVDGQTRATVNIAPTAGFQSYTTLTHSLGTLSAGTHVLRLQFDSTNGTRGVANVNWLKIVPVSTQTDTQAPSPVPNLRIDQGSRDGFFTYHLTWDGASDNVGVAGYRITYNYNNRFDRTIPQTVNLGPDARSFDTEVSDIHTLSDFKIAAFDAAGNIGPFVSPQTGGQNGLTGRYYHNSDFTGWAFDRTEPNINFDWGAGSPDPSMTADTFSVRWGGQIDIPTSGTYTFWASADDRARLVIDGVQVVNYIPGSTPNSGTINLTAGKHTIMYEYVEFTGRARAKLEWAGPGISRQVVPATRFSVT